MQYRIADGCAVLSTVGGQGADGTLDLIEQIREHRNVANRVRRQVHGGDREMQLAPAPMAPHAALLWVALLAFTLPLITEVILDPA